MASLSSGILTIDFTATGTTAESVTLTVNSTSILLSGDVFGATSNAIADVTKIVGLDSGSGSNQSLLIGGTSTLTLANGLSTNDIENVTINSAVSATGSSAISVVAPKAIIINSALSTIDGEIRLSANQQFIISPGTFTGVDINATLKSTTGNITVEGRGGSDFGIGVLVRDKGIVGSGTQGIVTVTGYGSGGVAGYGVHVSGFNARITSGGGDIFVNAFGAADYGTNNFGLFVASGQISAPGTANIQVTGVGRGGILNCMGVWVTGAITSVDGDITVVGKGGGNSSAMTGHGVALGFNGSITTTGAGDISIVGEGAKGPAGNENFGVFVSGNGKSVIRSDAGNVTVFGTGGGTGASIGNVGVRMDSNGLITTNQSGFVSVTGYGGNESGSGSNNFGVYIGGASKITSSGTGPVTVVGEGGSKSGTGGGNSGIHFRDLNSVISSNGGNVSITAQGGGTNSSANYGLEMQLSAQITSGGTGTITVVGKGGGAAGLGNSNRGVYVVGTETQIASGGGNVTIIGTGGGSAATSNNYGVSLFAAKIVAVGNAKVSISGFGGPATATNNIGFSLAGILMAHNGDIEINAVGAVSSYAIWASNGANVKTTGTGNIYIRTDSLLIDNSNCVFQAGPTANNTLTVQPHSNGTSIDIGSNDVLTGSPLVLGLQVAELDRFFAKSLIVGGEETGPIKVAVNFIRSIQTNTTLSSSASIALESTIDSANGDITLKSAGPITQSAGSINAGIGTLTLDAPDQPAMLNSLANQASQVVVTTKTLALVAGAIIEPGNVQVHGTLSGNALVGSVSVAWSGRIRPGTSPGRLTMAGLTMSENSVLEMELNGIAAEYGYDQVVVNGSVNLGNATLQAALGFVPPPGSKYVLVANDGADPVIGTFTGLAEGATVNLNGVDFTITYQGGDGNDVVLQAPGGAPPLPTIESITINDGAVQRSMVTSIKVTFSESVLLLPGAIQVERTGFGTPGLVATDVVQAGSSVTVTFKTGGSVAIDPGSSLADGVYQLTIFSDRVLGSSGGQLDGNGNGGEDPGTIDHGILNFNRLFGDGNGDGSVSAVDFNAFRMSYGSPGPSFFDVDGDNQVSAGDFNAFRARYGLTI